MSCADLLNDGFISIIIISPLIANIIRSRVILSERTQDCKVDNAIYTGFFSTKHCILCDYLCGYLCGKKQGDRPLRCYFKIRILFDIFIFSRKKYIFNKLNILKKEEIV